MFNNRKQHYVSDQNQCLPQQDRLQRLKFELREHIRCLDNYKPLSIEWLKMVDSLQQLANVAFMEVNMPPAYKSDKNQYGRKNSGTLWDQEKDEMSVRLLLEEGRLNQALRLMIEFKEFERSAQFIPAMVSLYQNQNVESCHITEKCKLFEKSLGVLLQLAFNHVESFQILDMNVLIEYIASILSFNGNSNKQYNPDDISRLQSTLVLHYLTACALHMEDCDEDKIMKLFLNYKIIDLLVIQLHKHYYWYRPEVLIIACRFFNLVFSSEEYVTHPHKYINRPDIKVQLVNFKILFLNDLLDKYISRKPISVLLDVIEKYSQSVNPSHLLSVKPITPVPSEFFDNSKSLNNPISFESPAVSSMSNSPSAILSTNPSKSTTDKLASATFANSRTFSSKPSDLDTHPKLLNTSIQTQPMSPLSDEKKSVLVKKKGRKSSIIIKPTGNV